MGWRVATRSTNVRAIVSYELGSGFLFPEGEVPPPEPMAGGTLPALGVPLSEFMALTKIPIVIGREPHVEGPRGETTRRVGAGEVT